MANKNLTNAKINKKDEFWTRLPDIENEMQYYKQHFEGKTVLCNCDDPFESNFFLYFALNFNHLKLKKLISTCYQGSAISEKKGLSHGYKIEVTEVKDLDGDGMLTTKDIKLMLELNPPVELEGDGSFDSDECIALLKESDIVATNPPFSRFRDYVALLMEHEKKFIILGNMNSVACKEIFHYIQNGEIFPGHLFNKTVEFIMPDSYELKGKGFIDEKGQKHGFVPSIAWYTNLDHKKRHKRLDLYMEYEGNEDYFPTYDNYNAIEVSKVIEIPKDYDGVMGVPVTFLDKYNPEQFEIVGMCENLDLYGLKTRVYTSQECKDRYFELFGKKGTYDLNASGVINGKKVYSRILIKRRKEK